MSVLLDELATADRNGPLCLGRTRHTSALKAHYPLLGKLVIPKQAGTMDEDIK